MISHLMQFDALAVVDKQMFLLGYGEHVFVLEEMNVSDQLFGLKFTFQLFLFPIEQSNMSFFRAD